MQVFSFLMEASSAIEDSAMIEVDNVQNRAVSTKNLTGLGRINLGTPTGS